MFWRVWHFRHTRTTQSPRKWGQRSPFRWTRIGAEIDTPSPGGLGVTVPVTKRRKWIESVTKTTSVRAAAVALGVDHGTLSRWIRTRMPADRVIKLVVEHECDLIEALVVWGHLDDADVEKLNYSALLKYFPGDVLADEVRDRYADFLSKNPDPYRKIKVGMLRRA
jgi:hypothetical protein